VAFAGICEFDMTPWRNLGLWADRVMALPRFKPPFALLQMQDAELS
jgi:hypothetical protein